MRRPDGLKAHASDDRLFALWRERYRLPNSPLPAALNDTLDGLLSHRSVRRYLPDPLPDGALEIAIAAAQSAPTSSNLQAWSVVIVDDPEQKARINAVSGNQRQVAEAPLLLVWLADLSRLRHVAAQRNFQSNALDYFESLVIGVIDAALAAQNALVAFESMGLGTCYIGALRNHPTAVAKELELPPEVFAVFGMTVGIADPAMATGVKPRLPQRVVVHRGRYEHAQLDDFQGYDARLRSFQAEQSMLQIDWTEQASRRNENAQILQNRDRLRSELMQMGFKLV